MEKVKLTQEQAEEIEIHKMGGQEQTDYVLNIHAFKKRPDKAIAELEVSELARALFIGYEVEPEFKIGDWVVYDNEVCVYDYEKKESDIYQSAGAHISGFTKGIPSYPFGRVVKFSELRHATPGEIAEEKNRRWWAKHNRDVGELKDRDLLIDVTTGEICTVWVKHNDLHLTTAGDVILSIYDPRKLKGNYEVLCFAEDRKDV